MAEVTESLGDHTEMLYRFAMSITRDPSQAGDLVQDTFIRALERSDQYRGDAPVGAWLRRILHNLAIDRARRATHEVIVEEIESLRSAGFSIEIAAHAFWMLDSYVYGHVIQENGIPISASDETNELPGSILEQDMIEEYLHLLEIGEHAQRSGFSFDDEFEFGLDLILDALGQTVTPTAG